MVSFSKKRELPSRIFKTLVILLLLAETSIGFSEKGDHSEAYAVVIGISHYREESIPQVPYAVRDAQAFASLLESHAGLPKSHIRLLTDAKATVGDFRNYLGDWLRMRVKAESVVYVYYAGHGSPNPNTGEGYIVPWDGHPDFPSGLFPLKDFYEMLSTLNVKEVIVLLDSCFSGYSGRSVLPKGTRPIGISADKQLSTGVIVLAAASGSQRSSDYEKVQHGLFTHYILTGLKGEADQDDDRIVTLKELYAYVRKNVSNTAIEELDREQTPSLFPTEEILGSRALLPLTKPPRGLHGKSKNQDSIATKGTDLAMVPGFDLSAKPQEIHGADDAPMILIPSGEFVMGSNEYNVEKIPHRIFLDSYHIDKYEVTTFQYARFLEETHRSQPYKWNDVGSNSRRPVIGVNWFDVDAYCRWAGKRLPTEAEWEMAARGPDARKYPWGNEESNSRVASYDWTGKRSWDGYITLAEVGSYEQGKSPFGVYDLAGNVAEWVYDWYNEHYYRNSPSRNPQGPPDGKDKIIRGGSWNHRPVYLRSTFRLRINPHERSTSIGFRCALSLPPSNQKP